jgi:hypothetical protein
MLLLDGSQTLRHQVQRCLPREALPFPLAPCTPTNHRILRALVVVFERFASDPAGAQLLPAEGVWVAPDMVYPAFFGHLDHHRAPDGTHSADAEDTSQILHEAGSHVAGEDGAFLVEMAERPR